MDGKSFLEMDGNDKFWSRWKAELTTTLGVLPMYTKKCTTMGY
jgi:hypothetical protein